MRRLRWLPVVVVALLAAWFMPEQVELWLDRQELAGEARAFEELAAKGHPALARVVRPPDEGREHTYPGIDVTYRTNPPTSGPHWPTWGLPGFCEEVQPLPVLVHSLEHGMVVVYYEHLDDETEIRLRLWTQFLKTEADGLLVVPWPGAGRGLILTAWGHRLDLETADLAAVAAFHREYAGRSRDGHVRQPAPPPAARRYPTPREDRWRGPRSDAPRTLAPDSPWR